MIPIIILHGWSDTSDSFKKLAKRLKKETNRSIKELWLGDYQSLDDDITMDDIVTSMQKAWKNADLSTTPNSVDVIVHSTGGLIIRDWMNKYWPGSKKPPVRNLVMLAPANFGSPLAHKGRSIIGRVLKGFGSEKTFQTGTHILKALEMASTYSWQLAEKDRFSKNAFNQGAVRCTVIVGNKGYSGLSSIANEDGTDGTVYVSTANLNCAKMNIDVERDSGNITVSKIIPSSGKTAFLILDGYDHSTITGNENLSKKLLNPIIKALNITESNFSNWCKECDISSKSIAKKYAKKRSSQKHAFQNTVFHIVDDTGSPILDYVLEFYGVFTDSRDKWSTIFTSHIINKVHNYSSDRSYRSFMMDISSMNKYIDKIDESLKFSLSALPDIENENTYVGYKTFGENDIGSFELKQNKIKKYFSSNRTILITITLPRYQKKEVFTFKHL